MKYMMLIAGEESELDGTADGERRAIYERIGAWWGEQAAAGHIVDGHELQPSSTATTVRVDPKGNARVTDGPFIEAKEVVGGFAILDVADLDEAIRVASGWPSPAALEIRPIVERG